MTKYILLLLTVLPTLAHAEDNLKTVLSRMKTTEATAISYKEKRTLKMLTEAWQGAGTLYAAPPHIMIKEQRSPEVEIMGIEGKQAYYFQQNNNQRYQTELDENELHVVAFNELLHNDLTALQKLYDTDFTSSAGHWTLTLSAKNQKPENDKQPAKIILQGLAEQAANSVTVIQADGDKSEFALSPPAKGAEAEKNIAKLLNVLKKAN
jgi:outer membrane lipoprotein-sorting protein